MKKIVRIALTAAMAGGMALGTGGVASAAHCVEGDSPGFSYYGNDHVAEESPHRAEGNNTGGPHKVEGEQTQGASACRDNTGSPSERAPGKQ